MRTDDADAELSFSPLPTVLNHDDYNTPTQHWYSDAISGLLHVGRNIVQDQNDEWGSQSRRHGLSPPFVERVEAGRGRGRVRYLLL
jgi:hypothetical protein